jgi:hypothetical protein
MRANSYPGLVLLRSFGSEGKSMTDLMNLGFLVLLFGSGVLFVMALDRLK